jgi:hypothetical protein
MNRCKLCGTFRRNLNAFGECTAAAQRTCARRAAARQPLNDWIRKHTLPPRGSKVGRPTDQESYE